MGLPHLINVACTEIWNGASMAFALCPLLTEGAIGALKAHGSRELTDLYLPPMVSGRWTGTMNLTEPQAGSDLSAVRTRAERAEDGSYRLFGQKIFITYGEHDLAENIIHFVLARLPGALAGTRGLSLFLAPKFLVNADGSLGQRNDLRCAGIEHKLGIHGSPTCVMVYGDNEGAKAWLVGEENRGLAAMFVMMNAARLAVGTQGVAIGDRAYQQALAYARERRQGRSPNGGDGMAADHRASRCAAHADDDEGQRPRRARDLSPDRRFARPCRTRCHRGRTNGGRQPGGVAYPHCQGVLDRHRRRDDIDRRPGPWGYGIHRGDRGGPAYAQFPHRRDLRRRERHSRDRSRAAQATAGKRRNRRATRSLESGRWRATSPGAAVEASARRRKGSPRPRTRSRIDAADARLARNRPEFGARRRVAISSLVRPHTWRRVPGQGWSGRRKAGGKRRRERAWPRRPRPLLYRENRGRRARPWRAVASGGAPLEPYETILAETA